MKLVAIFLPLLAHAMLAGRVRRFPITLTALAAALSLVITLLAVRWSSLWPDPNRIAWLGISATGDHRLAIGGPEEDSVSTWPNEATTPAMSLARQDDTTGLMLVDGGGAFVFVRGADGTSSWSPINGKELKPEEDCALDGYIFRVRPAGWWPSSLRFRLTIHAMGPERRLLADLPLRTNASDGSVVGLAPLVEHSTAILGGPLPERIVLRTWAEGVRLFVPHSRSEAVRVLQSSEKAKASFKLPCETIVRWAGNSPVKARLESSEGGIKCEFLRPWRWTSPLPDRHENSYPKITFCAQPYPREHAFILPLGRMTAAMRIDRELGLDDSKHLALIEPQSASRATLIPPEALEPRITLSSEQEVISRTALNAGNYRFDVGIIYDLPSFLGLVGAALPPLILFVLALWITAARMAVVEESRSAAFGLALSVWVFLCMRLLLALRYALEPAHVDRMAVEGVVGAYLGLATVPPFVLLVARLAFLRVQPLPHDRRARWLAIGLIGAIVGSIVLTGVLAGSLWPSWPTAGLRFTIAVAIAAGLCAVISGTLSYGTNPAEAGGLRTQLAIWCPPVMKVLRDLWKPVYKQGRGGWPLGAVTFILILTVAGSGYLLTLGGTRELAEEIWIPLGCIWLPVMFWLTGQASAAEAGTHGRPPIRLLVSLVFFFGVVPIGLQVTTSLDFGTAFAASAALLPLCCLLCVVRPRRMGLALFGVLLALSGAVVFLAFTAPASFDSFGEAGIRVRSFVNRERMQIQYLFGMGLAANDNPSGLKAEKILNVSQHTWENKALAHEGGAFGMGFGEAPLRRSQVPMHTVQCDSTFSFYILSEHGLAGGFALLLASFMPFFYVVGAARPREDIGIGLAIVITGAFAIEMLTQAAMNLGFLPFTGRNLPLLAVVSPTDLAKWTFLFGVAARALFLRYQRDGSLDPAANPLSAERWDALAKSRFARRIAVGVPATLLLLFCGADYRRIGDKSLDRPFTWQVLDDQVRELQDKGYVSVNDANYELNYVQKPPGQLSLKFDENRLLTQEIERFNQLPLEERYRESGVETFRKRIQTISDTSAYDALMDDVRKTSSTRRVQVHPPVFELRFVPDARDESGHQITSPNSTAFKDDESGKWEIHANGDFNRQLHFKLTPKQTELPELTWEGNRRSGILLGPAWAMGQEVIAYDADVPVPWLPQLAEALRQKWSEMGPVAASRFKRFTLSANLQASAVDFLARHGRAHHATLLAAAGQRTSSDASEVRERIPPRAALSILNLMPHKRGELVALASWPRTTSKAFWDRTSNGEWLPSTNWLEKNAPESVKRRYLGDRNFDLMLMGSATKPIFAAAALSAQPGIDERLHTKEGEDVVHELFGVRMPGPAWNETWHGGPGPWRDFENYLAYSDNRYHVRLGFLALAEREGNTIARAVPVQSKLVSLDKGSNPQPWMAFPKFPREIEFRHDHPDRIEKLDETVFARQLRALFSVGVTAGELRDARLSFWTGNEADDVRPSQSAKDITKSPFQYISPQTPSLDLDHILTPRNYIMVLLGGLTNTWSNVDFAGAFGTTVLGRPIVPHIIAGDQPPSPANRIDFLPIAERLRPGLKGVVKVGTASRYFAAGKDNVLERWSARGYELYAKTGTLEEDKVTSRKISRLVLALVRWKKAAPLEVRNGLVFSLVIEHSATGMATAWLREFIVDHDRDINEFLDRAE